MIEERLRRFLLLTTLGICVGTVIELLLSEHFGEPAQLIPFVLSVLGFFAVGVVLFRPQRRNILVMRGVMVLMGAGGVLGIALHLINNFEFELEIRPNAGVGDVLMDALMGANPLLAPGILALAAVLAIAATYYHPALKKESQ